jgi:transketolase
VVIGDGEAHEGIIAEAARMASDWQLDNLTCIMDYNRLQSDAHSVMMVNSLREFRAYGWQTVKADGHNLDELRYALSIRIEGKPLFIRANTVKGYGVSFMEDKPEWHGSVKITDSQLQEALAELQ